MKSTTNRLLAAVFAATLTWASDARAKAPPTEKLLPATTQLWVSFPEFQQTRTAWNQTQFGKLMDESIMKPLRDSLEQQFRDRRKKAGKNLGLTWDDLRQMAGGEACLALVHPAGSKPSRVALVDVTGRAEPAQATIKRLHANLIKQTAKQTQKKVGGVTVNIFTQAGEVRVVDFLAGDLFCAGGDEAMVVDILNRLLKKNDNHLASLKPFAQITARLEADQAVAPADAKAPAHVRWFVQPIGYGEAQRVLKPRDEDADGIDLLSVGKKIGFKSLMGIGGDVRFNNAKYDVLQRIAAYAPPPWTGSMNMLSIVNEGGLKATDNTWIPASLATHATCNLELLKAFDYYGPFFDEVVGGREGAWKRVQTQIADKVGPGVDLRKEIIQRLVTKKNGRLVARCIRAKDNRRPVSPSSERQLTAVKIYPSAADYVTLGKGPNGGPCTPDNATPAQHKRAMQVAEKEFRSVMERYFRPEVRSELTRVIKDAAPGIDIWERFPQEDDEDDEDDEKKPVALKIAAGGKKKVIPAPKVVPPESEAFCVTHGYYISTTHKSLMLKVLDHIANRGVPLAEDLDYLTVMDCIDKELKLRNWPSASARRFSRTHEEFFNVYELARAGRAEETDNIFARLLSRVVDIEGTDDRKAIDFSKLPPYAKVRPYFNPSGLLIHTETGGENAGVKGWNGWFAVGFTLK